MRYTSSARFLGLPLFEFVLAEPGGSRQFKPVAKAWVAVGDIALSPLLAIGGLAFGSVAIGGLAMGGFALGGAAIGVLSLGGFSAGGWAVGGMALGIKSALGGFAASPGFALGGAAYGPQANSPAAREFFAHAPVWLVPSGRFFLLFLPFTLLPWLANRRDSSAHLTKPT